MQADPEDIPHVGEKAHAGFIDYIYANPHKAFAIAPGGAWSWRSDAASATEARKLAVESCESHTRQKCIAYAVNNDLVFDPQQWSSLWGPYLDRTVAAQRPTGVQEGQRFYDILFRNGAGEARSISDLRGKLVLVHFWGPWCTPCMREFPELRHFHRQLEKRLPGQVEMVLLQVRDSFENSQRWLKNNEFDDLPVSDSGVTCAEQTTLSLTDGSTIEDRIIARVFPTTYVLDKNGVVLFRHQGPVADWREYLPFFEHAARHSGR